MKMKRLKRTLAAAISAAMIVGTMAVPSFAYIERGDVSISGNSSYTLKAGEMAELSVNPYEEQHYPGCQMPECPTICGEKNCIVYVDGQQECVCAGTEMVTYYASVNASSSDSSVASASYSDGTVTITAKSAGTAEISIDASFREYNDASKSVSITVEAEASDNSGTSGDTPSSDNGSGGSNTGSQPSGGSTGGTSGGNSSQGSSTGSTPSENTGSTGGTPAGSSENTSAGSTTGGTTVSVPAIDTDKKDETTTTTVPEENTVTAVTFSDVSGWAESYITYLSGKGIVNGKTATEFAPDDSITRAEFVKIIAGVAGADVSAYTASSFSDVNSDAWYAAYVAWAADKGIVTGSNGQFSPSDQISRQDMAVIITRYLEKVAGKTLTDSCDEVSFSDSCCIASYASDAVCRMQKAGIISGKGNNTFAPADSATRAEACKMLASVMQQTAA